MPPAAPTAPGRGRQRSAPPPPRTCELGRAGAGGDAAGPGVQTPRSQHRTSGRAPQSIATRHRRSRSCGNFVRGEEGKKERDNTLYSSNGQKSPSASVTCSEEEAGERGSGGTLRPPPLPRPAGPRDYAQEGLGLNYNQVGRSPSPASRCPVPRRWVFKGVLITLRFFPPFLCALPKGKIEEGKKKKKSLPQGTLQHFARLFKRCVPTQQKAEK